MKHRILAFGLLLSLSTTLYAQETTPSRHTHPNIATGWNSRHDSTLIGRINVGPLAFVDSLRGMQWGWLFGGARQSASGLMLAGLANGAHDMRGVQLASLHNYAINALHSVQLAAVSNVAKGMDGGLQWAGLMNIASGNMRGVQLALYNYADTLRGSQWGLLNVAVNHLHGWQVGIINYTRDTTTHKIGLVNINPKTHIDVMLGAGTASKFNTAVRFRNRLTYSIIGVGTHYMGFDQDFSGALFYRFGRYFQLSRRFSLSGDLGFYHIETFHKATDARPSHLYSLQAHVNADYQLSPYAGLYASVGYGTTHHYGSHLNYRTRPIVEAGVTLRYHHDSKGGVQLWEEERERDKNYQLGKAMENPNADLFRWNDPAYTKNRWGIAAAEAAGINVLVHCFDRFVMKEHFAETTLNTIRHNFSTGFVWDNDQFSTNLFAHPYHGNLYFNSARSNGLSFWQSTPYALGGSLMWEFFGEREPAAINDVLATTMGGICIGEVMHRVSALVLNDHTRGGNRFWREALAFVVNPMQGFNRLCTGDAWRVRQDKYLYHDFSKIPVLFTISIGDRYLADQGSFSRGEHQPVVKFNLSYGDLFDTDDQQPYSYFHATTAFGFTGNQPLINNLHLIGRLWGRSYTSSTEGQVMWGFFQHFNYYDSKPVKDGSTQTPYRISEAASVGPGWAWLFPTVGNLAYLRQEVYLDGILLGGTKSDYYNVIDRDYNMGSGFSLKSNTTMVFPRVGAFTLLVDYYRIYTWKGYEDKDLATTDPLYLNAQGDKSNAELVVVNPQFLFHLKHNWGIELSASYYARRTRYKYHPNVGTQTYEVRAALLYRL